MPGLEPAVIGSAELVEGSEFDHVRFPELDFVDVWIWIS
jgi:hypothetical protein